MSGAISPLIHDVCAQSVVSQSLAQARDAIDSLLFDRRLRTVSASVVGQVVIGAGRDGAALDGAEATGELDESPIGRYIAAAIAATAECAVLRDVAERSPAQALARLHVVATSWVQDDDERGRPRSGDEADDPLHIRRPLTSDQARAELLRACNLFMNSDLPGLAAAAHVHALIATSAPFRHGSMAVARGASRLMVSVRGVDPDGIVPIESGLHVLGRSSYASALKAFTSADPTEWFIHFAQATHRAALTVREVLLS